MVLQNQHFISKGFPLISLFQRSVEVGVGVFDECFFRYQTSLESLGRQLKRLVTVLDIQPGEKYRT